MTMTESTTVVGVFTDRVQAEKAIEELHTLGFNDNNIGFILRDEQGPPTDGTLAEAPLETTSRTTAGLMGGTVVGGIVGAVASLLIPGFGPAVAGGILALTLGGAAVGATAGGIIGALTDLGIADEDARYYQSEFEAGRVIITVNAPDRQDEVLALLRSNGAYDAHMRQSVVASPDESYGQTDAALQPGYIVEKPVNPTTAPDYDPTNPVTGAAYDANRPPTAPNP